MVEVTLPGERARGGSCEVFYRISERLSLDLRQTARRPRSRGAGDDRIKPTVLLVTRDWDKARLLLAQALRS